MSIAEELYYELRGPDAAPVVVLSGSLGTDLSMWDPQLRQLSAQFRVLRYDMRGHGAALCGLSIGGMLSIWAAAHAPERVSQLVVCCSAASLRPEVREAYTARAAAVRERGIEPIADEVLARWFTPGFACDNRSVIERFRRMLIATAPEGYAGCCEALAAMDLRSELAAIAAPTLVVAGARDLALPPEHSRWIAEQIDSARLTVVSRAAHLASVERSELVTGLMLSFLAPEQ